MSVDDFLRLVRALRKEGALAVEVGDWKVSFAPALPEAPDFEVPQESPDEAMRQFLLDNYGSSIR